MSVSVVSQRARELGGLSWPELALIDLDGTLVDSVPDLALCVDQMMEQLGHAPRGETAVRAWIGSGAAVAVASLIVVLLVMGRRRRS